VLCVNALQELIFTVEGFKPFGWYLTLVQFALYTSFAVTEVHLNKDRKRRLTYLYDFVINNNSICVFGDIVPPALRSLVT